MKTNVICLLILLLSISGCGDVDCPGYPEEQKDWFPYKVGQEIVFSNETDFISLQISRYNASVPHSFDKSCDCECEAYLAFESTMETDKLFSIKGIVVLDNTRYLEMDIQKYEISKNRIIIPIAKNSYHISLEKDAVLPNIDINGKEFSNVIILKNDNPEVRFPEIKIAKGYGIIELVDMEQQSWFLDIGK